MRTIILVEEMEILGDIITNYEKIVEGMNFGINTNNARFNEEIEKIVKKMC